MVGGACVYIMNGLVRLMSQAFESRLTRPLLLLIGDKSIFNLFNSDYNPVTIIEII